MSATQRSRPPLPQTWEHTAGQAQRPDDTGRIIFTRQLWRRNMPDGNNIEQGVLNKSQSQDAHESQKTSAPSSRRGSLNVTTRSRRRSPSPSRESKTPLTPEESPPFTTSRKRSASIVEIEDTALDSATTTPIHSRGSSGDSTLHVCICQPDPKIPRPRNAFILYRQHHQAQVVSQNPGLANPEISKIIGEQWQNQPIEIKNKWKGLAEEEKLRHQQQYPTYRYQPKRTGRRGSLSTDANASGEKPKCVKCGGRSTLIPSTPSGISPASVPPTPGSVITPVSRTLPGLNNLSLQSPAVRRMGRAFHYSNMSPVHNTHGEERDDVGPLSPDLKRRKYNGDYGPQMSRTMPQRYAVAPPGVQVGPGTPFPFALPPQSPHPYPPAVMQARRESLPGLRGVVSPPGPMPPPPRPGMGYQQHRISQGHIHHDRSLQLPPLQTGSVSGPSGAAASSASGKTVDEQIMAMPFRYKVKVLSQVAPPAPMDATPRGPLIAIEGDSVDAVADLGKWLCEELKKSTDLAVTQFASPDLAADGGEKKTKKPMVQYHLLASEWLAKSDEIIEAISYKPAAIPVDSVMTDPSPKEPASSHRNIDENYDDTDSPAKPTPPPLPTALPPASNMDLDTPPTPTPTTTTTTTALPIATNTPKPVGLIADYSLRASNVFACRIPIGPHDPYSPSDHWQWTATQWRGVVGPDLTVFVRDAGVGEAGKATVEIMEEGGLIVVKRSVGGGDGEGSGSGGVDASVLRRLGFEVGEWVRAFGGVKGGST
ncbi:slightly ste11-like protein [Friedmanniomyces endolithicus]|nr:slightly ste11-like protein [Friedmanniomyces endolithicus]KAK0296065.1 slightly ste11-like protein [Friedmanniomyces endolithicus]KAK0918291.1 slightly ste11-like protein [Friedmanniomyces endolithicus]KAK0976172.1 slightly ste11-like protein [Friedmanniomyces endolithicus]KAK0991070.1 slightly ste11-like protein [Friedmanniomyces endolithicus]